MEHLDRLEPREPGAGGFVAGGLVDVDGRRAVIGARTRGPSRPGDLAGAAAGGGDASARCGSRRRGRRRLGGQEHLVLRRVAVEVSRRSEEVEPVVARGQRGEVLGRVGCEGRRRGVRGRPGPVSHHATSDVEPAGGVDLSVIDGHGRGVRAAWSPFGASGSTVPTGCSMAVSGGGVGTIAARRRSFHQRRPTTWAGGVLEWIISACPNRGRRARKYGTSDSRFA